MTKKYAIWNKVDPIITPIGEVLTAEQWVERFPVAGLDNITVVCSVGEINGGFFGTLGQMVHMYENEGLDFSTATTDEEKLELIEAFEDSRNATIAAMASEEEDPVVTYLASIADSLAIIAAALRKE